ncbi:MAG TPA: pitrilysin family protein [Blastocatellia bacterium]|jgi:zinc protease|nr:pitrilysin family protein [Blastocatellia bacterium]
MRFSKLITLVSCGVLLIGVLAPVAGAQKKDKDKDKDKNPPVPEVIPPTPYSGVRRDNLLNGLQVITLERAGDANVKCDLVIRAGAMFDLAGKTGQAALTLETLLAVNPQLKEEIESLQGKIDWGLNWDTTWFHIETPANNFDAVFEILGRLLVVDNVRPEAFKRAHQERLEKVKSIKLPPAEQADEAFYKAVYGDHPYGHNIDGGEGSVTGLKQADVYDFLKRFYIANNVSIVVTGNITHERAMRPFKTFFGGWTKGQPVPATFRQPAQTVQSRVVKVEIPDAPNVELRGGMIGLRSADPDFLVAQMMTRILNARLKREAESIGGSFTAQSPRRILSGPLYFSATIPADQASAFSIKATESFASLATTAVSADELAAAKSGMLEEHAARSIDDYLREIEVFKTPKTYPLTIKENIEKITAAEVQRAAKRIFDANAMTVVALGRVGANFKSNP